MTILDTKVVFIFDQKDKKDKIDSLGKEVVYLDTIELKFPCSLILVETDKEVCLKNINLYEENGNWLKYRGKRKAAVSRRERRSKAQSK